MELHQFKFSFSCLIFFSAMLAKGAPMPGVGCESVLNTLESKVLNGVSPSTEEWDRFLCRIYQEQPACSPRVFAGHATNLGPGTYELLASAFSKARQAGQTILDLGTGSGYLLTFLKKDLSHTDRIIGIDMSHDELKIAKSDHGSDPRISFLNSFAQKIPLGNNSVDLITAHMSLMMMKPIEPVVLEILRVLKPGGKLFAVTNSLDSSPGTLGVISKIIETFFKDRFPKFAKLPVGDPRTRSYVGIKELFRPKFSKIVSYQPFYLNMEFTPEAAWEFCYTLGSVNIIPKEQQGELKNIILKYVEGNIGKNGKVVLSMPLILWVVEK